MADVRLEAALNRAEPAIASAFREMIAVMSASVPFRELARLIEAGDFEGALARTLQAAGRLPRAVNTQFINAADNVAQQIGRRIGNIVIDFDNTSEFVVQAQRRNQLRLIQGFTNQQRLATRRALIDAQQRGLNPTETARVFRQSIGLTDRQMQAVINFRNSLENLSTDALRRELRDGRFDRTILRAIDRGEPLSRTQIDRMVQRYSDRALAHRARVIARTEAQRAVNEGNQAMFDQAFADGTLNRDGIIREWNTALDERVRASHSSMHGQTVGATTPFVSGQGNATQHPGGFGIAEEDIQCRCTVGTRITDLAIPGRVDVQVVG